MRRIMKWQLDGHDVAYPLYREPPKNPLTGLEVVLVATLLALLAYLAYGIFAVPPHWDGMQCRGMDPSTVVSAPTVLELPDCKEYVLHG